MTRGQYAKRIRDRQAYWEDRQHSLHWWQWLKRRKYMAYHTAYSLAVEWLAEETELPIPVSRKTKCWCGHNYDRHRTWDAAGGYTRCLMCACENYEAFVMPRPEPLELP